MELYTYYGVEAPREVFWRHIGDELACARNQQHGICAGAKFCPECGAATKAVHLEVPSERFAEVCQAAGFEPADGFMLLTGGMAANGLREWKWQDENGDSERSLKLYWVDVSAFITEVACAQVMALGFKISRVEAPRWKLETPKIMGVSWRELEAYERAARNVGKVFGLEGEPKLYSQVCYM